ncbi:hypothetical protein [Wolbachia endosymbiont of Oedothorax gibbosus]|nr:hypothetical protein [Wolbachia endosymbiont of Oedothorax gibbosus]
MNVKPLMHFSSLLISSVGKITPILSTSAEFSINPSCGLEVSEKDREIG